MYCYSYGVAFITEGANIDEGILVAFVAFFGVAGIIIVVTTAAIIMAMVKILVIIVDAFLAFIFIFPIINRQSQIFKHL